MKTILFFFLLFITFAAHPQETNYADFPVTTHSPQALQLYYQGIQELVKVHVYESMDSFDKAIKLDPDFFMPYFMNAMYNLARPDREPFKSLAYRAINCKASLNESEKLLQQVLKKLMEDPKADVTEYGEKLVKLNPKSFFAYQLLATFQGFIKDYESVNNTCQAILRLPNYPDIIYNSMGYNYMKMNQMDKARQAFDKYMKAEPNNAYCYNSMGDYYVQLGDFQSAYDYYMKAYKLDSIHHKSPINVDLRTKPFMVDY